jgi:hypothetical protein
VQYLFLEWLVPHDICPLLSANYEQINDHLYPFRLAVTGVTVPIVVVCGSHVAVDFSLLLPDAVLLGPSTWHTNEKLSAKLLRMGLGKWWTGQNTHFVPKSPLVNNFETDTCQIPIIM